jgi:hypothetical protein
VTGDALYCQRDLCRQIGDAGGDYLLVVKRNQLSLHDDIAFLFAQPPPGEVIATACQSDRQGDRQEHRQIWV